MEVMVAAAGSGVVEYTNSGCTGCKVAYWGWPELLGGSEMVEVAAMGEGAGTTSAAVNTGVTVR